MTRFDGLIVLCNGCGKAMRDLGEWPVAFPRSTEGVTKNIHQAFRYTCTTCKMPHPEVAAGIPVMATILGKASS